MSTAVSVRLQSRERDLFYGLLRDWFYFSMSLLIAGIVIYGFSQQAEMQLIHPLHRKPLVMWIHSVVFPAWVLFYIAQSALVASTTSGYIAGSVGSELCWERRCPFWAQSPLRSCDVLTCNTAI